MAGAWLARLLPRKPEFGGCRGPRQPETGYGRRSRRGQLGAAGEAQLVIRWCVLTWLAVTAHLADTSKHDGCLFPPRWSGKWFQSGVIQPIVIEGERQSNKGKCLSSEGDKFIIVDEKGCYRCVVMHEKHINVLQYKETFCHTRDALPHLCSMITGDALLYSMFRENAAPVACPLKGPFSFTYNRGHGDCKSPVSSIESCTEESRLLLNYQACPDVYGSESTVEELECLATWKEGSLRFLVGKVHHNHATSNEDRYRCFVYEKTNGLGSTSISKDTGDGVEYRVAQSGDATCNGLFSATEGSRTMALKRVPTQWKCRFPTWMTFSGHWHTLDYTSMYSFHQKNATLRITNQTGADIKVHCVQVKASSQTGNSVLLVAHWQHHCVSHFVCVLLYRRDAHVAELQRGAPTLRADDACLPEYFNAKEAPYVTLVTSNPASRKCPFPGKFDISSIKYRQRNIRSLNHINDYLERRKYEYKHHKGKKRFEAERRRRRYEKRLREVLMRETQKNRDAHSIYDIYMNFNKTKSTPNSLKKQSLARMRRSDPQNEGSAQCAASNFNALDIGCNIPENLEFRSVCENKDVVTAYSCHGGWYEDGTSFLIITPLTRDSIGARRYCFLSRESPHGSIHFTRSSVNCDRSLRPGIDGALVFNTSRTVGVHCSSAPMDEPRLYGIPEISTERNTHYEHKVAVR